MRNYKILLISFILLIFMIGAVSASDADNILTDGDPGGFVPDEPIIVDEGDDEGDEGNIKEIYVNDTGDDSNIGSAESPYATIGKAISNISDSDKATIYLSEGIFASDNDANFDIQLLHKNNDGSLAIIGAGADKTIIDGQSAFRFASFGWNTNVTLKDITFINFKQYTGAVINANGGTITIENCIFKDSYATGNQGGAIKMQYNNGELTVKNSSFINCSVRGTSNWQAGGGAIHVTSIASLNLVDNVFIGTSIAAGSGVAVYSQSKSYISGNKFINLTGKNDASVYINDFSGSTICNNEFINCSNPSTTSSILTIAYGKCELRNNTFTNSSNSVGNIYSTGTVSGLIVKMDDSVIDISNAEINNGIDISVNVTDDMGNIVKTTGYTINFVNENNTYTLNPSERNDKIHLNFASMPEIGIYNVTATCGGITGDVLTTADIHYSNEVVDLYVSPEGSDANDGSFEAPFETIQHAIDVGFEKTFNVVVHVLKGTYYGEGNVELTIANKGTLQLLGEAYNETIIDGNEETWLFNVKTETTIKNLKFVNALGNVILGNEKVTLIDCIIDNNNGEGNSIVSDVNMDNLIFTNNNGCIYLSENVMVNNSYFANNYYEYGSGGVFLIDNWLDKNVIENCKFINNTAGENGGVIYVSDSNGLLIKNCYFEGNSAQNGGVIDICSFVTYTFENNTFVNNNAQSNGVIALEMDGYEVFMSPALIFNDCNFINNSAVNAGVSTLKIGIFNDCSFINNSADYGGVFMVLPYCVEPEEPVYIDSDNSDETITSLVFNNVVFENNIANINGNDIYLAPKDSWYWGDDSMYQYIPLTITFNDLNVTSLVDDLTANVTGPSGAIVGSADDLTFEFNGTKIGSAKIDNGVATFNYAGFEDGEYILSGKVYLPHSETVINDAKVIVKLENVLDHVEFWVSNDGSDETGNGSESNPFKSISHAVDEAIKNCRDITIHIGEGVYTGDLNTELSLSSMNNLTLIGAGIDKTIIDGENSTYFATVTDGKNKVVISDLTIKNMLPDNRQTRILDSASPITIFAGANVLLDNVEIVDNHGGNAIIVNGGNLAINNSVIKRNGLTKYGIICGINDQNYRTSEGGNLSIDNTLIEDNYAYINQRNTPLIYADNLVINNSEIKNGYLLANNVYYLGFALINHEDHADGNVIIENTNISHDGSLEELNELGVNTEGIMVNPAVNVNGNTYMNNCTMVIDYNGTLNTNTQVAYISYPSAFGYTYTTPRNVSVHNTSIINYQYLWMATTYSLHNYVFDGCVFENLDYIAWIRTNNPDSNYNITNSVFLNCSNVIMQNHYAPMATPQHVNLNDNYWGNNSKPIIYFLDQGTFKDDVVEPDTWIVLFSEDEKAIIKNVTDGENSTNYTGIAPIREGYADNKGMLDYAVVFGPVGYLFTTDDDDNVIFNPEDAIYPFEDVDPMNYRDNAVMNINKINGSGAVFGTIGDVMGNPIANATIVYTLNGVEANTTTDENGSFVVLGGNGDLNITFVGNDMYFPIENVLTLENIAPVKTETKFDLAVDGNLLITGILSDINGNKLANVPFTYVVNGSEVNATTDANGAFTIEGINNDTVVLTFAGDDSYLAASTSLKLDNIAPTRIATVIESDYTFTRQANDYSAGERGDFFYATLKDINGNPIANVTCYVAVNGPIYNVTTDENGKFGVQVNLAAANTYTYALSFLGNENYEASLNCSKLVLTAKKTTITAKAKAFKAKAKTKTISVTLSTVKNPYDGKTYLKAGKKLTMKLNGKTYTAKINAKGVAKFTIKLTKKGKYTAKITFAGDKTYKASSKSIKVTIK